MSSFAEQLEDDYVGRELGLEPLPDGDRAALDAWVDWQLQVIAELQVRCAENKAVAERRKQMIENWLLDENAVIENRIAHITERIRAHTMGYDFGDKKSRKLPHGAFGFRKQPDAVKVVDASAVLGFCKANGIPYKTEEKPLVPALKEYLASTGTVPIGCELVAGSEAFYVSAKD